VRVEVETAVGLIPPVPDAAAAIDLVGLTKVFRKARRAEGTTVTAIEDISLSVRPGEVFGLLGPNGAGKSTTIRIIATLLAPSAGSVRVCGIDALRHPRQARQRIGTVLGGERSVYWKLTGRQNLEYFAALYGLPRRIARERITAVLNRFGLRDAADDYVERYSTGMRQRLVIARALLHEPVVLLLDEPTLGLDPRAAQTLHECIRQLRDSGHAVVLTTHYLEEADALSDRLAIVDHGRLVVQGTAAELKRGLGAVQTMRLRLRATHPDAVDATRDELRQRGTIASTEAADDAIDLVLRSASVDDLVPWAIAVAARHDVTVLKVDVEPVSLRDVFLAVTGRELDR